MSIGGIGFFAGGLAFESAGGVFAANEGRLGLANQVSNYVIANGELTPQQMVAVAQEDKAPTLKGEQAKIDLEVAHTMQDAEKAIRQKERQFKDRLKNAGAIFF